MAYYRTDQPSLVADEHHTTSPLITSNNQSHTTASATVLPSNTSHRVHRKCILGVCAMDKKLQSKPMRQILDRLRGYGEFEILLMGNSLILDDSTDIQQWPVVDCLISFTSSGFPLQRVIDYVKLRRPFCVNDLPSQSLLLQRADVYRQLEAAGIPTPRHLYARRDDPLAADTPSCHIEQTDDYISVNGERMLLPVVEKPFDGDDHNVYIYYGKRHGGGSRRLFRKIGNRSSRYYPHVNTLRKHGSYIYEELLKNGKDLKVYTIGPGYAHGELRKSPVVDGIVERDLDKKELRLLTKLTEQEKQIAAAICVAFKQNICGFDMIRWRGKSYVIDVNGWSFVKGNMRYYDKCARILRKMCLGCRQGRAALALPKQLPAQWPPTDNQCYQPAPAQQSILPDLQLNDTQLQQIKSTQSINTTKSHKSLHSFLPSIAVGTLAGAYGAISSSLINSITPSRLTTHRTSTQTSTNPSTTSSTSHSTSPLHTYPIDIQAATDYIQRSNLIMDTDNNDVLRSVVAVFRHADRTPKQKVKMRTKYPDLLALFPVIDHNTIQSQSQQQTTTTVDGKSTDPTLALFSELKFKRPSDYSVILDIIQRMIDREVQRQTAPTPDDVAAMQAARQAELQYADDTDINTVNNGTDTDIDKDRAMERVYLREKREREKRENEKDPDYLAKLMRVRTVLIKQYPGIKVQLKPTKTANGGQMTHAGIGQARQYAAAFWDDILPPPQNPLIYTIPFQHPNNSVNHSNPSPAPIELNGQQTNKNTIHDSTKSSPLVTSRSLLSSPVKLSTQPSTMRQREQEQIRQAAVNAASPDVEVACINSDLSALNETSVVMDANSTVNQSDRRQWLDMLSNIKRTDTPATLTAQELIAQNDVQSNDKTVPSNTQQRHHSTSSSISGVQSLQSTNTAGMTTNSMYDTDAFRSKQKAFEAQRLRFIQGIQLFSSDEARVVASTEAFYQSTMEYCSGIVDTENEPSSNTASILKQIAADMSKSVHHGSDVNVFLDDTSMCITDMQRAKEAVRFLLTADHLWTPGQVTSHMIMREHLELASNEAERLEAEREERDLLAAAKKAAEQREMRERERAELRRKKRYEEEKLELLLDQQATLEPDNNDDNNNNNDVQTSQQHNNTDTGSITPVHDNSTDAPRLSITTPLTSPTTPGVNQFSRHPSMPRSPVNLPDSPKSPPLSPGSSSFSSTAMTQWGMRCLRWIGKPHDTLYKLYQLLVDLQTQIHKKCEFVQQYQTINSQLLNTELQRRRQQSREVALVDEDMISKQRAPDGTIQHNLPRTVSGNVREKYSTGSNADVQSEDESADVFEYVFDEGDEEIVGTHQKIKRADRTFPVDHELCGAETLLLLKSRWDKLISDFYDSEKQTFDPTKIPDVYDCIKYDVLHNAEFLTGVRPLYTAAKRVADFVVPHEYGVLRKDKWHIGAAISQRLWQRIVTDLQAGLQDQPPPKNRVTLYFSSESHIHALRNVLLLSGIADNETVATVLDSIELNYLSHAVFRLYEDLTKPVDDPNRFYVNVQFSPGAALDPFIFTETGHILPVSRPVPVNGRVPFDKFKQMFTNISHLNMEYVSKDIHTNIK